MSASAWRSLRIGFDRTRSSSSLEGIPLQSVRTLRTSALCYMAQLAGSPSPPSSAAGLAGRPRSPIRVPGPVETSIQAKLMDAFHPTLIRISNDSSKHSHHAPMRAIGGGGGETHFAVAIVSSSFAGKTQIQRHRLVNSLLKEEFDEKGLHALSLRLKTPEEWEKEVPAS